MKVVLHLEAKGKKREIDGFTFHAETKKEVALLEKIAHGKISRLPYAKKATVFPFLIGAGRFAIRIIPPDGCK